MKSFDVIVIGSGAGLNVAAAAAEQGLKVAIIEEGPLGGTCLNRGCIPSKIVIHSAETAEIINNASKFGLTATLNKVNFNAVTSRASATVDSDARSIEKNITSERNPVLFKGRGKFVDKKIIEVNGEKITGKKIVIAAGARPFIPPIPGLNTVPYITSTEALRQTKLPHSMIILGGGYIGVELGFFYAALGTKVTIVQRNSTLIPREDKDIAAALTSIWKKKYHLLLNTDALKVESDGKKIAVTVKTGTKTTKISAEKLLVATGVKPNTDTLALEKCGIEMTKQGFIKVNKFMETNIKNVWALGDIAGIYLFRHSANLEADYVLNNIIGTKKAVDYYPMPHAIFTEPQIAGVGLTEQEAIEQKKKYVIGKYDYKDTGMGEALAEKDGFVKLLVDPATKEILGCHIMGPQASVLLHEVTVAMKAGKNKALYLLRNTVHVHPALSEVVSRAALNVDIQ